MLFIDFTAAVFPYLACIVHGYYYYYYYFHLSNFLHFMQGDNTSDTVTADFAVLWIADISLLSN